MAAALLVLALAQGAGAQSNSPSSTTSPSSSTDALLDLFVKKGYVTQEEAQKVKDEAAGSVSNAQMPALKWKISDGIKSVELFGDIRFRYEDRQAEAPTDARIDLGASATRCGWDCAGIWRTIFIMGFGWKPRPIRGRRGSLLALRLPAVCLTRGPLANPPPG